MDLSLAPTSQAPTQSVGTVRHATSETAQRQDFASIMLRNNTLSGSGLKQPKQPTPTELAQDAISITLVQPILAQLRAPSQAWGPSAVGRPFRVPRLSRSDASADSVSTRFRTSIHRPGRPP